MKRIVVTGAQGFVGRYLVRALDRSGHPVRILALGRSPESRHHFTHQLSWMGRRVPAPLPEGFDELRAPYRYRQVDVCDQAALAELLREFQPHWVFHLASALRDDDPAALCRANVQGTVALTQALADAGCRPEKIVYGSTGAVYGLAATLPLHEDADLAPCTLYGATKLAAEQCSRLIAARHGFPAVWARLFNLAGPGQDERHVCGYFAGSVARMLAQDRVGPLATGPLAATRDFIDVRDAAHALVLLAEAGEPGLAYNVASGREVPVREVLASVLRQAGLEGRVAADEAAARAGDVPRHVAAVGRLRHLGFAPAIDIDRSIADLLAYYSTQVARAVRQPDEWRA